VRLLYAFPEPLPLERARGIQTVHSVAALAAQGVDVTLAHVPSSGDPFAAYSVAMPGKVRLLPVSRSLPWPFARMHSNRFFAARLAKHIDPGETGAVMARHLKAAALLAEKIPSFSFDLIFGVPGQTLEMWQGDAEDQGDVDLSSTVYSMIDTILRFLRVDKYTHVVKRSGRAGDFLIDIYPEVYSGLDDNELRHLLQAHEFSAEEIEEIAGHVANRGSCYVPRMNAIFIGRLNLVHAGEEAAHFVNLALKGEIYDDAPREMPQHDLFYNGVLEEALGFFGSKLIDPGRNHFFETAFYQYYRKDRETIERETAYTYEDFNAIIHFILLHKKFEQNYGTYEDVPPEILAGIRSEPRRANILIHELGYFLGQQLHDAYRAGVIDRRDIARLFRDSFRVSGSALKTYLDLTERVRPALQEGSTPQPSPGGGGSEAP